MSNSQPSPSDLPRMQRPGSTDRDRGRPVSPQNPTDAWESEGAHEFVDVATIRQLSQISPWRGVGQIVLEWLAIAAAIAISVPSRNAAVYIASVVWIGARQNALAVMMHEAVHYRLLRHRVWNDWVGDILAAWPVLVTVSGYRQTHFAHHRHVNTPRDPDWVRKKDDSAFRYPRPAVQIVKITVGYLSGIYALRELVGVNREGRLTPEVRNSRLAAYALVVSASLVFGFWKEFILYWLVPLFTWFLWAIWIRGVAEHFAGIENGPGLIGRTRHVQAGFLERLLIAPNNINVHVAHHLYPSVPFYRLSQLQKILMKNADYANRSRITRGYVALFREFRGQANGR